MRILAFNFVLATATGILFGFAPAMQSMRLDLWTTLKDVAGAVYRRGLLRPFTQSPGDGPGRVVVPATGRRGLFVKSLNNLKDTQHWISRHWKSCHLSDRSGAQRPRQSASEAVP